MFMYEHSTDLNECVTLAITYFRYLLFLDNAFKKPHWSYSDCEPRPLKK